MKRVLFVLVALLQLSFITASAQEQTLWLQYGSRRIFGRIHYPVNYAESQRHPVAIISHGFNATHHVGYNYFNELAQMGYICYAMDFPGGSVHSRSDNNTMHMSVRDEQHDVEAIVRYFQTRPDVDANRIILIGESQGGMVSALAAAAMPRAIERLVLIFPALCIPDNWHSYSIDVADAPDTVRIWNVPLGHHFLEALNGMDIYREIAAYKRPVLIVHGDADPVVPIDYSRRAVKTYRRASLHEIPNAGHGFRPEEQKLSLGWIREFLSEK